MVNLSKFTSNNKLLSNIIFVKVIHSVTWTQSPPPTHTHTHTNHTDRLDIFNAINETNGWSLAKKSHKEKRNS